MSKRLNIIISADTRRLNKALESSSRKMQRFGRRMSLMGTDLMRSVTVPVTLAGGALIKLGGELDGSKRALAAVMGSTKAAKEEFLALKEAAKQPGLDFPAAIQGSLRFQSMGIEADRARAMLTGFGKAVALSGGGADEFGRTLQQVSDMFARGAVRMEDWRRIMQATPAVVSALREEFQGMGTDAVAISEEIGFDEFMSRLTRRLNETTGAGDSLKNSLNNLMSSTKHLGGEIGILLSEYSGLTEAIDTAVKWMDDFAVRLMEDEEFAAQFGERISTLGKTLVYIAGAGVGMKVVGVIGMLGSGAMTAAKGINTLASAMLGLNFGAVGSKTIGSTMFFAGAGVKTLASSMTKAITMAIPVINWTIIGTLLAKHFGESFGEAIYDKLKEMFGGEAVGRIFTTIFAGTGRLGALSETIPDALGVTGNIPLSEQEITGVDKLSPESVQRLLKLLKGGTVGLEEFEDAAKKKAEQLKKNEERLEMYKDMVDKANASLRKVNATYKITGDREQWVSDRADALRDAMINLEAEGFGASAAFKRFARELKDVGLEADLLAMKFDEINDKVFDIDNNPYGLNFMDTTIDAGSDVNKPAWMDTALRRRPDGTYIGEDTNGLFQEEEINAQDLANQRFQEMEEKLQNIVAIGDRLGGVFANAFGQMIDGSKTFGEVMKDVLKQVLQMLIKMVVKMLIVKTLMNIIMPGSGVAYDFISGGINSDILGKIFGGGGGRGGGGATPMLGFADGGIARGATPAIFGEYTNAYNKPELAGRVDQWAGLIDGFMSGRYGGGGGERSEVVLRGEDLVIAVERTINRRSRRGGGFGGLSLSN